MTPASLLVLQHGKQVGPFPAEAVREMLAAGTLSPQDFAWAEGMPEWVPLEALFPDVPAAPQPVPAAAAATSGAPAFQLPPERSFASFVGDAFSYPFRGDGVIILITGTIVFTVLEAVPKIGIYGMILSIGLWGYLLLMLQSVIHGTAQGEDTLPRWPSFTGFGELFEKWVQWLVLMVLCFGPAYGVFFAAFFKSPEDPTPDWMLVGGLGLAGALYFPMAALGVAMFDSLAALNPLLVVRAIFATPLHYVLTLIVIAGLGAVQMLTGQVAGKIPILGTVVDQFDALWSAIFLARLLGGLYYVNRRKLGWF